MDAVLYVRRPGPEVFRKRRIALPHAPPGNKYPLEGGTYDHGFLLESKLANIQKKKKQWKGKLITWTISNKILVWIKIQFKIQFKMHYFFIFFRLQNKYHTP